MRELRDHLAQWVTAGHSFALATVVGIRGSAPRPPGATLAVAGDGEVVGSISGGCVEAAVYESAHEVLESGASRVETYGITDDDAYAVGLTCGGIIDVLVTPAGATTAATLASLDKDEPVALASVVAGGEIGAQLAVWGDRSTGTLGDPGLDVAVRADAQGMLTQGITATRHYGRHGERRVDEVAVFVQSFAPPPRMIVFGAIDFAAAVARIGGFLGYHVTVCDARPVFATKKRFPDADEVVVAWPHDYLAQLTVTPSTVICVLTHDPKFDGPVLEIALRSPAAYVGAMGSRRTHADRVRRLLDAGLTEAQVARLRSPIGLDIGSRTPEETAVSIAAEIVALRWGGSGMPLGETEGPIHMSGGQVG